MKKIVVNCEYNTLANIQNGETEILGFDFYVKDEVNTIELMEHIKQLLNNHNRPLLNIYTERLYNTGYNESTLEFIGKTIQEGY